MIVEIAKKTGTYADSLQAIGTANLIEEIAGRQTVIRDMGPFFQVECASDVLPAQWKPPSPGFYYIWLRSKEREKPPGILVMDYEEEQRRAKANKENRKKIKKEVLNKALEEQGIAGIEEVDPEYRFAAILASMRKGWSSDKDVYLWVSNHPQEALAWAQDELLRKSSGKTPLQVSNSQFFNPISGKGVHAAKTMSKSPGAICKEIIEPFAEWMKFRGAFQSMLSYRSGDDFKLFVIEPAEISPKSIFYLRKELLAMQLWGGIHLDIEASLRLAELMIMHSDVMEGTIGLRKKQPSEVIKGLRQAFFKSMGTAAALMNDAFLPLPSWFTIENRDDANAYLEIIREHIGEYNPGKPGCLASLNESHSGDVPILQQYRKWLTTGELLDLLVFFARFAVHVMEKGGKEKQVKEFTTKNLTILFERGYGMKEIVENPGFLSIARGVRNCTIYAVSLGKREPHFGLAQQWKQKIKGGDKEFIPALSDFVQTQNWEIEYRLKGKEHVIQKEDLDDVITLIEKYGSELVGMLLLAYGYSRAPKTDNENLSKEEGK